VVYQFLLPIAICLPVDFKEDEDILELKVQKYFGEIYWTRNGRAGAVAKWR